MRWPWRRAEADDAKRAVRDAQAQYDRAKARGAHAASTVGKARALKRTADRFAAEFEQSMHHQRGSA